MVEKHAIFQGYYFFHYIGGDRNLREQFRDHEWFARTEEFCARYDGPAFDPSGETLPLAFFTSTKTGEIQSRLANDVGGVQSVVTTTASTILANVVTFVSTFVARYGPFCSTPPVPMRMVV